MRICIYAISCRAGGALSVLKDLHQEITQKSSSYPNVDWYFLTSIQLQESQNVHVCVYENSIRSWCSRFYFNIITAKNFLKMNKIDAVLSLQNMSITGYQGISIISLHNVLPLYKCNKSVLDSFTTRIKQRIKNVFIIRSLKKASAIIVPSEWIKLALVKKYNISKGSVFLSHVDIPQSINGSKKYVPENNGETIFFYPAKSFPYKNHEILVKACKLLIDQGYSNFKVLFTFDKDQSKTSRKLASFVETNKMPIEFVGTLKREKVLELYSEAVLVFPSNIETDAMPILECIQNDGSLIAADLDYAHDLLDDYLKKDYCNARDPEAWAIAMKKYLDNEVIQYSSPASKKVLVNEKTRLDIIVSIVDSMRRNSQ